MLQIGGLGGSLSNQDYDGGRIAATSAGLQFECGDRASSRMMLGSISWLLVQPIYDSRFYRVTKVSFLPAESLHDLQSQSSLNLV
jgi:hypothetical protein